jgi:hypothetical protein
LQPKKQFKSSAPKGVKYGAGYTDRARARAEAGDGEDEKAERIKALEEQMKLGQIPVETFEALRDEIAGGDVASTHLVKGLDRRLLERVRRGEDVMGVGGGNAGTEAPVDVDEELDKLEDREVETVQREKAQKRGTMAPPPPVAGVKRSRDEIMAELKAQRKAAAEAKPAPALDSSKWKKVGEKEKSRIEIDHKGREVLITVDEDGIVKKKVRKVQPKDAMESKAAILMPDANKAVLGADANIPSQQERPNDESDDGDDIFEGVGAEYNPLGDDDEDEDDSTDSDLSEGEVERKPIRERPSAKPRNENVKESKDRDAAESKPAAPRNYFKDTPSTNEEAEEDRLAGVQNILKKAAKIGATHSGSDDENADETVQAKEARLKKRAEMVAQQDRDLEDMDMGFGSNRFDDGEDDGEGSKVKLSEWKGSIADDMAGGEGRGKDGGKKKRKPKKRKGDANNMADIMRVIEGRKSEEKKAK